MIVHSRVRRGLGAVAVVLVAGVGAAACTPPAADCAGFSPRPLPEFVFGSAATDINPDAMVRAAGHGYRWARIPLRWQHVQPTVDALPTLTRAELRARPELVDEFAVTADWSTTDTSLRSAALNGLQVIGFVGVTPPQFGGRTLDPSTMGRETYLAGVELTTRAIVRRYGRDRIGAPADIPTVQVWQLENELNIAPFATLINWRTPGGFEGFFDSPWADWAFLTELLRTIGDAVKAEDGEAVTMFNLSTDSAAAFNTPFGRPDWPEQVSQWRTLADVVGIDTYPNYFLPGPVDGAQVGRDLQVVRDRVCPGQQYLVVETNYPNGPVARGYSPESQAAYLQAAWESARSAGTSGFMPFAIGTVGPDDEQFSDRDLANLSLLGRGVRDGDLGLLAQMFLGDPEWVANRLSSATQAVEGRWGLAGPQGPYPAAGVVEAIRIETDGWASDELRGG